MSLTSALQIGRSGLSAGQVGIQVAGNNIANAATPGYSRQLMNLSPTPGSRTPPLGSVGRGVTIDNIRRQVDMAMQARLWSSAGSGAAARQQAQILSQIEATLGELGDSSLSGELGEFFRVWSESANLTSANSVVVQQGEKLASFMRGLRQDLIDQRHQLDGQLSAAVEQASALMDTIADLNRQIAGAEVAGGTANSLRDQRDEAVTQLSEYMDVAVVDHGTQGYDVLVGSTPVVLGGTSRGLQLKRVTVDGSTELSISTRNDARSIQISSGIIGGMLSGRSEEVDRILGQLDQVAGQLIFQVNRLHGTGRNLAGITEATSTFRMTLAEQAMALNDPNNVSTASLPYGARSGGFDVVVRNLSTNTTQTVRVSIDLDGVTNAGTPGFDDDTSLEDIRTALGGVSGLTATITPEGRLSVQAQDGFDFSFSEDSSDVVATLGLNSYFAGTDAASIGVRSDLESDPSKLTVGRVVDGAFVENGTSLKIAQLQDQTLDALGGQSISESWRSTGEAVGVKAAGAQTRANAAGLVRESLMAQRDSYSGVSIDEESIDLINFQRLYQGSAKLISIVDELTQQLINLV